jgi:hypothetical protein
MFLGIAASLAVAAWATAAAASSIEAGTVIIEPGDTSVVVPIEATTDDPMTLLSVDVSFDRSLCEQVDGIEVIAAGRTRGEFQEGGSRCPQEGRVRLVALDLTGQPVIPAGEGVIANLEFRVRPGGAGEFPLALSVNQASNGPVALALVAVGAKAAGAGCAGDCDGDGEVSVAELIEVVNIALRAGSVGACASVDRNGDGVVSIAEVIGAVSAGLAGCAG